MEDSPAFQFEPLEYSGSSLFDGDLNHKIRTILAVIQGSAEFLESYGLSMSQEERHTLFSDIYDAVAQIEDALTEDSTHTRQDNPLG